MVIMNHIDANNGTMPDEGRHGEPDLQLPWLDMEPRDREVRRPWRDAF